MRTIFAVLTLGLAAALPPAPSYDVTKSVGDHDFMFSFRQQAEAAFTAPQDNTLSTWRVLPFPWKFFGKEVTGYFISDNGYVTFDKNATVSLAKPVALTEAAAPSNSIFAYWSDLRLDAGQGQWTNSVWTATMGTSPTRVHLIYWLGVAPGGLSFMIAIYENGEFEVIYTTAREAGARDGFVGAISGDGAVRVTAAGPGFAFPTVGFGGDDDIAFRFKPVEK